MMPCTDPLTTEAGFGCARFVRHAQAGLAALLLLASIGGCRSSALRNQPSETDVKQFVSQNFFSIDLPADWVARDLRDGANLFFADELIFVRVKIFEPPDPKTVSDYVAEKIKADADVHGGQAQLLRIGYKGPHPYSNYLITKLNGQRIQESLLYNADLQLLYVLQGSSRPEDFDEFSRLFEWMFQSFQFRVTARVPNEQASVPSLDYTTMSGTWVAYLEGLRREDYSLLQRSCAGVNGSKIINDVTVREVKAKYFPYQNQLYTFVSHIEIRDKLAVARVALRALPPEGFLTHETREFIQEDGQWRLLRFDKVE